MCSPVYYSSLVKNELMVLSEVLGLSHISASGKIHFYTGLLHMHHKHAIVTGETFVTRKVTRSVAQIHLGHRESVSPACSPGDN